MKKAILFIFLLTNFIAQAHSQDIEKIDWMTEEYPPLNYTENGVVTGVFVDVLAAMWNKLGIKGAASNIKVLPWARSYKLVQKVPGTALFAMSRTKERENLFKWVGPINVSPIGIIAKKEKNYRFNSISDINSLLGHKRLGAVREDSGSHYFLEGEGDKKLLFPVWEGDLLVKMLKADRVDAIAYSYGVARYLMKKNNIDTSKYELVYELKPAAQGWYAFHKDTNIATLDRLQNVFDQLTEDGTIHQIHESYK